MPLSQKSINFGGLWIKVDSFALDVLACELSMSMSLDMASIFHLLLFVMLLLFVVCVFFPCLCSPWPNVQPAGLEGGHTLSSFLGKLVYAQRFLRRPDNAVSCFVDTNYLMVPTV